MGGGGGGGSGGGFSDIGATAIGGVMQLTGMQSAASQQQDVANHQVAQDELNARTALSIAKPSFQQLQQQQLQYTMSSDLLSSQLKSLNSQYQLYQSASDQAKSLMSGQSAATLAPMQQQQKLQRTQLENKLRAQLGSGYATTSAGSMALSNFDMQSSFATSQAQQQATGMYLGAAQSLGGQYTQGLNSAYTTAGQLNLGGLASQAQSQELQLNAITGNKINYNNQIATAGANMTGLIGGGSLVNTVGNQAASNASTAASSFGSLL